MKTEGFPALPTRTLWRTDLDWVNTSGYGNLLKATSHFWKKGLGDYRELYLNLIRFTRRLLQLDFRNKEEVKVLQKAIETKERVAERSWLLEKLQKTKQA